jgi:hypothetical protein
MEQAAQTSLQRHALVGLDEQVVEEQPDEEQEAVPQHSGKERAEKHSLC